MWMIPQPYQNFWSVTRRTSRALVAAGCDGGSFLRDQRAPYRALLSMRLWNS